MKPMTYAEIGAIFGTTGHHIRCVEQVALRKIRSRLHDIRRDIIFRRGIDIYHGIIHPDDHTEEPTQPLSPWDERGQFRMLSKLISEKSRHFWRRRGRTRAPHLSETFSTSPLQ